MRNLGSLKTYEDVDMWFRQNPKNDVLLPPPTNPPPAPYEAPNTYFSVTEPEVSNPAAESTINTKNDMT